MSIAFYYAFGTFLTDASLYFLATVPFWGHERIKKSLILPIFANVLFVRAAAAYVFAAFVPDGLVWDLYFYLAYMIVILTGYFICYKIHIAKLLYTMLILMLIGTLVNYLSYFAASPFHTEQMIVYATLPNLITTAVAWAIVLPFAYRLFKSTFRNAFTILSIKSILVLCIMPAMFIVLFVLSGMIIRSVEIPIVMEMLFDLSLTLTGIVSCFINIRMVERVSVNAKLEIEIANAKRREHELSAETEFYRKMSHSLRTPLTVVSTSVQVAKNHPDKADELLLQSQSEIMKMAKMIDDALDDGGGAEV